MMKYLTKYGFFESANDHCKNNSSVMTFSQCETFDMAEIQLQMKNNGIIHYTTLEILLMLFYDGRRQIVTPFEKITKIVSRFNLNLLVLIGFIFTPNEVYSYCSFVEAAASDQSHFLAENSSAWW